MRRWEIPIDRLDVEPERALAAWADLVPQELDELPELASDPRRFSGLVVAAPDEMSADEVRANIRQALTKLGSKASVGLPREYP